MNVKAGNSLWTDRIKRDADAQLAAKGWTATLQTYYDGFGGGWFWRGGSDFATTTVENMEVGTLVVDIFNAHDKKLIWRGTASKVLSDKPEKNEKKLESDVEDMFKHFPPQSRG